MKLRVLGYISFLQIQLIIWGLYTGLLYADQAPLVTIITSVYNGDKFIEGFMKDITRQTIYNQCEHIIINANSPGNEEPVIKKYMQKYPNIIYQRLEMWVRAVKGGALFKKIPGIYGLFYSNPQGLSAAGFKRVNNKFVRDPNATPEQQERRLKIKQELIRMRRKHADLFYKK